jgi:LysM repeat protein
MRDEQQQQNNQDNKSEYLKFVGVLALFLAVILCLALLLPPLFSNAIPAALGLNENSADASDTIPPLNNSGEEHPTETEPADSGPDSQLPEGPEALVVHTVQEGETMTQIATDYNVSLEALAAANNIINPQQVVTGSVLVIPQPQ